MTGFSVDRRGRTKTVEVDAIEILIDSDGHRMVSSECPWCRKVEWHLVPLDILPSAPLERSPKCGAQKGLLRLRMPPAA
jgi:hypothetical protein